jgi:hypothetical protein
MRKAADEAAFWFLWLRVYQRTRITQASYLKATAVPDISALPILAGHRQVWKSPIIQWEVDHALANEVAGAARCGHRDRMFLMAIGASPEKDLGAMHGGLQAHGAALHHPHTQVR